MNNYFSADLLKQLEIASVLNNRLNTKYSSSSIRSWSINLQQYPLILRIFYLEIVYHTQLQDKKESYLAPEIQELWYSPIETSKEWIWNGTIKTTK